MAEQSRAAIDLPGARNPGPSVNLSTYLPTLYLIYIPYTLHLIPYTILIQYLYLPTYSLTFSFHIYPEAPLWIDLPRKKPTLFCQPSPLCFTYIPTYLLTDLLTFPPIHLVPFLTFPPIYLLLTLFYPTCLLRNLLTFFQGLDWYSSTRALFNLDPFPDLADSSFQFGHFHLI